MSGNFVHLHTHTEYSPLDGLSTTKEIVAAVKADGQTAVAFTDHGNCAAHPDAQIICEAEGVKPIFGLEAYFVDDRFAREGKVTDYWHLILWAMDDEGLKNLWAMSTESYRDGLWGKYARLDWDTLQRLNKGVMCSTACLGGPVLNPFIKGDEELAVSNLLRLKEIFGDRLYAEIQTGMQEDQLRGNAWLLEEAWRYKIEPVITCDSHYSTPQEKAAHKVWLASAIGKTLDELADSSMFEGDEDYHVMPGIEVRGYLGANRDYAEEHGGCPDYLVEILERAFTNTQTIADRCSAKIELSSHTPVYSRKTQDHPDPAKHDIERLLTQCMDRWDERTSGKKHGSTAYMRRFENEFTMIAAKGFAGYFLMVADLVGYAKGTGILVGPGRGSGGGSLVAYLLGITEIDPVEHDVLFERFMTKGRTELPDFDIDFPSSKKAEMYGYVAKRWGESNVATVGTHMRLKSKSVIQSVARALKDTLPEGHWTDMMECSKIIEAAEGDTAGLGLSWDELWDRAGDLLQPYADRYPDVFLYAKRFHGRLKAYGKHPAGVIIDPDHPLTENLPLRMGEDGTMIAQFDLKVLELLGYVKFDLLNIANLDMIQTAMDLIFEHTGKRINPYAWTEELEDPLLYDQIGKGHCLGLFQIGSAIGTAMSRRMKPGGLHELADMVTLVRPGPARSGLTDRYLARRKGEEEVYYPDERMREVLGKTWGCFAAETRVTTKQGVREIGDLVGSKHDLMTTGGVWTNAEVRSFGVQPLMKVSLRRNKQEKVIYATSNHRWFGRWSDSKSKVKELLTTELRSGMVLAAQLPRRVASRSTPSPFGITAGIVFGDGTRTENQASVRLYGEKDAQLLKYFPNSRTRSYAPHGGPNAVPYIEVIDLPRSWREAPRLDEGTSYLYGWLAGYFAADGQVTAKGVPLITSARREDLERFRTVAQLVGIGTYGITQKVTRSPLPGSTEPREAVVYDLGLVASTLAEDFFLIEEHRRRFSAARAIRQKADRVQWAVVSVEETDRVEEVFCAVVPETHAFVLEDNILTGNSMIYQEQLMKLCMVLAQYDDVEADKVRKILGKKKVEEAKKEGARFIERAMANGTDEAVTRELWAQMEEFARYSFGFAHALAYAILGVWTAWFKFHYPLYFMCGALSTAKDDDVRVSYVEETRRMGYKVLSPDINLSGRGFSIGDTGLDIRYGMDAIKGLGPIAVESIIAGQPYASWEDFLERRGSKVNKGHIATMVKLGVFDSLEPNRRVLEERLAFDSLPAAQRCAHRAEDDRKLVWLPSPKRGVPMAPETASWTLPCGFDWLSEPETTSERTGKLERRKAPPKTCSKGCRQWTEAAGLGDVTVAPYSAAEIRAIEQELLGTYLSSTPFDVIPAEDMEQFATADDIESGGLGNYMVAAVIQGVRKIQTKKGDAMAIVTLSTPRGSFTTAAFPSLWEQQGDQFVKGSLAYALVTKGDRGCRLDTFIPIQGVTA
jgi:DNA polymerase III alpha subunit